MEEECLNASKRRKIEEIVLQILKASDLETTTESSIRSSAADQLGFELSGVNHLRLVRRLVDSFLLSKAADILRTTSLDRINDGSNTHHNADTRMKQRPQQRLNGGGNQLGANYNGKIICTLSDRRRVTVYDVAGRNMVAIRDFHIKDGNMFPEIGPNSGISLNATQWSSFRNSFPSIQEAIGKLESRLRSEADARQSEADVTSSVADSANEKSKTETYLSNLTSVVHPPIKRKRNEGERNSVADSAAEKSQTQAGISNLVSIIHPHIKSEQTEADASEAMIASNSQEHILVERQQEAAVDAVCPEKLIPSERKQTEDNSTLVPSFPSRRHLHHIANASQPERLIPMLPTRFDGRNYHSWRHQMEFFLNQLNIAYVLSELCPSISLNPEASFEEKVKVKAAAQRWIDDDCMCRHNMLNSLCDNLFQLYSQKCYSARELWEELKLLYDDDFGTKRSQINKYIRFQMVDGVSILEQVQELHRIADSVIASGTWIDENFHVSVIVSKLPPSWKELRARLMQEEFLPLNMLMHRLRVEEESRNCQNKETKSKKDHVTERKLDNRPGTRKYENKRVCYSCGKEGHMIKSCPDRKSEASDKSYGVENGVLSPCTGTITVDAEKTK